MNFIVSIKKTEQGILLVITDEGVVGCYFEEERKVLDLRKEFYKGESLDKKKVEDLLVKGVYFHFTGKEAVALGIEKDLIQTKNILFVAGIPHAEVVVTL